MSIAGFGMFTTGRRACRKGRTPCEVVAIAASRAPTFETGKVLRESVNE